MTAPTGSIRSSLRHRSFRRLLVALAVSQAGDWLYNVALLAFVYERTHSAGWVAVTTAVRVVPVVLLGPIGGVLADRFDRRRLMVLSDLARVACMLGLTAVAAAGLPILLAPLLAALSTAASAAYPASAAATTPRLVPDADLPGANAARSAVGMAAVAGGPVVGAVLLLLGSPGVAFLANAGTFAISALAVLSIPAGPAFCPARSGERGSVVADVVLGARALRAHPAALRLVGADIMCSVVYGMQTVLLLLLSRALGFGDAGYGYVLAGMGIGGILGTALTSRAARSTHPRRVLVLALLGVAAPAALMAATPCLTGLLCWAVLGGAGAVLVEVLCETSLQRDLDEHVFARAYGIAFPAAIAGIVGGSLVAAPLVSAVGLTGALVATGVLTAAYALVVAVPRRAGGRHRAARLPQPAALLPEPQEDVRPAEPVAV
ncbi:MAG: transporter [Blastococcus sp.]|nr:transporter [Blastococcus sp.]